MEIEVFPMDLTSNENILVMICYYIYTQMLDCVGYT